MRAITKILEKSNILLRAAQQNAKLAMIGLRVKSLFSFMEICLSSTRTNMHIGN